MSVQYPPGKALTLTLDPVGNRVVLQDSDNGLTSYSWDRQNRLAGLVNPYAETTTILFDALDRETGRVLGNGVGVSHTFDAAGRELVLANRNASGAALAVFTSSYDSVGDRLTVLELDGTPVTLAHDALRRLVNEQRAGTSAYNTSYLYDPVGNRLVKDDSGQLTTGTYNAAHELTLLQPPSGPPTTSLYDANGNLIQENTGGSVTTCLWDGEDRLVLVQNPDGTANTYLYSADGKRQKQITAAGTVNFVRDGENVLLETDVNLITQAHYTDFPGAWGGLASERRGSSSSFYLFDSQSNARDLVSAAGSVTDSYVYKAFGEELSVGGATANPFRFGGLVGYYRDSASRLYVRARHLRTDLGRWMSRDPAGGGPPDNPYGYAEGNPVTAVDPSGRLSIVPSLPDQWRIGRSAGPGCCCGKFRAIWSFQLDTADHTAPKDGWIVQQVHWRRQTHRCDAVDRNQADLHYLEAWPIAAGDLHPTIRGDAGYDDHFINGFPGEGMAAFLLQGVAITGLARYLESGQGMPAVPPYDPKGRMAGFHSAGQQCNQYAGILYCMDIFPPNPPAWWTQSQSADGAAGRHDAWSAWCCCVPAQGAWQSYSTATQGPGLPVPPC